MDEIRYKTLDEMKWASIRETEYGKVYLWYEGPMVYNPKYNTYELPDEGEAPEQAGLETWMQENFGVKPLTKEEYLKENHDPEFLEFELWRDELNGIWLDNAMYGRYGFNIGELGYNFTFGPLGSGLYPEPYPGTC